jgi:hypothetical protein
LEEELTPISKCRIDIRAGIASGADDVFILDRKDSQRIHNDLTYPLVKGENVARGDLDGPLKSILNPYTTDGRLVDLHNYPDAKEYLEYHRSKLEERYCVRKMNKYWYETHDSIDTERESKKRIVTPDITASARFAITERNISHNTCYSLYYTGDLSALAGILSSNVSEFLLKSSLPKMDSGYWRQMKRDLKNLAILDPQNLDDNDRDRLSQAFDDRDWSKLNERVYDIMGIGPAEKERIEDYIS